MAFLHYLLPLLSAITIFLTLVSKAHSQESKFSFYKFDTNNIKPLLFDGDAKLSGNVIKLTKNDAKGNPAKNSVGRIIHSRQVRIRNSKKNPIAFSTIETTFQIRVSSSPTKEIAGHGLAFFIAPLSYSFSPIPKDSFGGYLGLFSNNTLPPTVDYPNSPKPIIFVEFDNYVDGRWDPRYKHIGINVNTTRSRATVPWEVRSGQILTTRVRYNPSNMILEVLSFYDQFTQYQVSSSVEVNSLSEYVRVGFSASTGDNAVETHELISWTFSSSNP